MSLLSWNLLALSKSGVFGYAAPEPGINDRSADTMVKVYGTSRKSLKPLPALKVLPSAWIIRGAA